MSTFLYRPFETLQRLNINLLVFVAIYFVGLAWFLSKIQLLGTTVKKSTEQNARKLGSIYSPLLKSLTKLAIIGLVMLVLAYPLTLTIYITTISGNNSRVHLAAVIGASILFASTCSVILLILRTYQKQRLAVVVMTAFFSLLLGFGLIVQQDYKLAWQYQQQFWSDVIRLCPDLTKETVILVEKNYLKNPKYWQAFGWETPYVIQYIYQVSEPINFKNPKAKPILFLLKGNWKNQILTKDSLLTITPSIIKGPPSQPIIKVSSHNVIFLEVKNGKLTRRTEPLTINGEKFVLKPLTTDELFPFKKGYLYDHLIIEKNIDDRSSNYLK